MQQHIDFPMAISSLDNLMKTPLSKVALLKHHNTFLVSLSHFWLSHAKDYHFVQSDLVGRGFQKAKTVCDFCSNLLPEKLDPCHI